MIQGLYVGATGMKTHSEGMQIVSNNLANVSTVGYKQQMMLFSDLMYQGLSLGGSSEIVQSQRGMGSSVSDIRTLFTDGNFEQGNDMMDLAITGKGFFQVADAKGNFYYTRAGNFRFYADGTLRNPSGMAVTGIPIKDGKEQGGLTEISINLNDAATAIDPPKASTSLTALMNINVTTDKVSDPENPYFSLLSAWNGAQTPPLTSTDYSQPLKFYGADGRQHEATIRFDAASSANGQKIVEYVVTIPPGEDGRANAQGSQGAGLLMAGTLTFGPSGELTNMSAFTPGDGDLKDLNNWTPAALVDGVPQFTATFAGQPPQTISLNLGATGSGGWNAGTASAAAVGTNPGNLPGLTDPRFSTAKTTSYPVSSALSSYTQDGHGTGQLSEVSVDDAGVITAFYSNGQSHELYRIPLFRFTSEDGLRREGNNLYSATPESGAMQYGTAGTENYGTIIGNTLETSNVDMTREMTNMIVVQRGFQSNSKSITTVDAMIQKAIELKR